MCSPPVFAFLKSPFEYFQADILLLDDEIKRVSNSGINTVLSIVSFLFTAFFNEE